MVTNLAYSFENDYRTDFFEFMDKRLNQMEEDTELGSINNITKMIFELSWGYKQKGNTHYYVSSGVGGWGPPIRTVNRPEIISIKLNFNNQ